MLNTHLIKILRSFSKEELTSFADFIYSPFFNKSKTVHKLWEAIKKYAPGFEHADLEKEKIFAIVFEGKEYNYGTMKNLIHSFTQLTEKFLEISIYEKDKFQQTYNSLTYCLSKYFPDLFRKKFDKSIKELENLSEGGEQHYLYKYQLQWMSAALTGLESKKDMVVFRQAESLICFFLIHLFKIKHNIMTFYIEDNFIEENDLAEMFLKNIDMNKILEGIKKVNPQDFDIVNLYYHMHLCRRDPGNDNYFLPYKEMLLNSKKYLHEDEFNSLARTFPNIMNQRAYMGIKGTKKETAEFFKFLIDSGISLGNTDSKISTTYFTAIIKYLLQVKDFEYAQRFFEKFSSDIAGKDKENLKNYYLSYLYYEKNDINSSLEYSGKIKPDVNMYKFGIKILQIKCYFELGESEPFKYTLDAYRQLIYRADFINESLKNYTKNFLNSVNALFEYKVFQKGNLAEIKFDIVNNKMSNKEWILEKLEEIENK